MAIIDIKNVSVSYNSHEALKDISCKVETGDFIGFVGPNGAGKTTLIKAIFGLVPVKEGNIELFGTPAKKFTNWDKIGYLPQQSTSINPLFPANVREVVLLGLLSRKKWPRKITRHDRTKVDEIAEKLKIGHLKKRMFSELSGGQQQKVLLARCLVSEPQLLIFDEPSTALDPDSRESFFELIKDLNIKSKIAVILITHDTGYVGRFAEKLLYLDKNLIFFGKFSDFCKSEKMGLYFGEHHQHIICHQHHDASDKHHHTHYPPHDAIEGEKI
ncbi:MAG: ABC transporter ATP-binding protein [Planctomycetes bacterium GWF2_41_51]|nr:MAG: ABC transporter ATP-binding protein [Planctomycetes bacterium GWF2_41_51]HBG28693.1 ABC transporter ATP-binding protein [Phycisphaerales bacterium]